MSPARKRRNHTDQPRCKRAAPIQRAAPVQRVAPQVFTPRSTPQSAYQQAGPSRPENSSQLRMPTEIFQAVNPNLQRVNPNVSLTIRPPACNPNAQRFNPNLAQPRSVCRCKGGNALKLGPGKPNFQSGADESPVPAASSRSGRPSGREHAQQVLADLKVRSSSGLAVIGGSSFPSPPWRRPHRRFLLVSGRLRVH